MRESKIVLALLLALVLIIFGASAVLASDLSDAEYKGTITITNAGTATTNVSIPLEVDPDALIDNGYIMSDYTNTCIKSGGADTAYMPPVSPSDIWVFFAASVPESTSSAQFYMGGPTDMLGKIKYFPGIAGMVVIDVAGLEHGNNFQDDITGTYFDTSDIPTPVNTGFELNSDWTGGSRSALDPFVGSYAWYVQATEATVRVYQDVSGFVPGATYTFICYSEPYSAQPAQSIKVGIDDGVGETLSASNIAAGYKAMSVTRTLDAAATRLRLELVITGDVGTGTRHAMFDEAKLITREVISKQNAYYLWSGDGDITATMVTTSGYLDVSSTKTSGEYTVRALADTTDFELYVTDLVTPADSVALGGLSIPNNTNDWYMGKSGVSYIGSITMTVGGAPVSAWEWENDPTFHDSIGANDATPTFRTTSSDADVSAELTTLEPYSTPSAPSAGSSSVWEMIPDTPAAPVGLYSELGLSFWGNSWCKMFATSTGYDISIPVFFYAFTIVIGAGLLAYRITMGRKNNGQYSRKGSLFVMTLAMALVLWYFVANGGGVIPGLVLIPFGVIAVCCMIWEKNPFPWS